MHTDTTHVSYTSSPEVDVGTANDASSAALNDADTANEVNAAVNFLGNVDGESDTFNDGDDDGVGTPPRSDGEEEETVRRRYRAA